ncbi:MAG: hypothetical protein IJC29_04950 [Clostridia bacterium]|nr:hypothetical protein [Clostridia bacterium]
MKNTRKSSFISLLLALTLLVSNFAVLAIGTSAATTAPTEGAEIWDGTVATEYAGGTGTEEDPYLISTAAQFAYFRNTEAANATADTYYLLTADLWLNGESYSNNFTTVAASFAGVFDGNNRTIYNAGVSVNKAAVFGTVTGTIKNLKLNGVQATSGSTYQGVVSAGVYSLGDGGLLDNVHVLNGSVGALRPSGLAANASGTSTFNNCSYSGTLYVRNASNDSGTFGGIVGSVGPTSGGTTTVTGCTVNLTVTFDYSRKIYFGGIVGGVGNDWVTGAPKHEELIVEDCTANGTFSNPNATTNANTVIGGIVGKVGAATSYVNKVTVVGCTNNMTLDAPSQTYVGGILGWEKTAVSTTVTDCANYGAVSGATAGGIVGYGTRASATYLNCANYGTVTGTTSAGAFCGQAAAAQVLENCLFVVPEGSTTTALLGATSTATMTAESCFVITANGAAYTDAETYGFSAYADGNSGAMIDALNSYAVENSLSLWERNEEKGYPVVTGSAAESSDTLSVWDGATYTQPTAVDAATGDILIQSAAEFMWLLNNVTTADTATYRMTVDVNISAAAMTDKNADTESFAATLNGDGHKVIGLKLSGGNSPTCVIRTVTGTIQNIAFEGVNLTGTYNIALVGTLNGTLSGVTVEGTVTARGPAFLVYSMKAGAVVENCTTYGSVTGNANSPASALVVYMDGGTISGCKNYATITKTDSYTNNIGGLVGEAKSSACVIENCTNYGDITVSQNKGNVGGIIGYAEISITLRNCVNYGKITQQQASGASVGGIAGKIGKNSSTTYTVTGCINYGDLESAGSRVGGILGHHNFNTTSIATNCANYGSVTGATKVGGLIGESNGKHYANQDAHLRFVNCANYGDVTATAGYAGGYVGYLERGNKSTTAHAFQNVVIQGTVTGVTGAGALIGYINSSAATSTCKISLTNVFLEVSLKAASETTQLGRLAGETHYTSDDPLNVDTAASSNVYLNVKGYDSTDAEVDSLYDHYNANGVAGTEDLSGVQITGTTALADGTVAGLMNTFAGLNSYTGWLQGESAPELIPCVLKLTSANLHLGSKLTMNLKMKASIVSTIQQSITAIYVTNGTASFVGELIDDIYVFAVTGINAQDFSKLSYWKVVVQIDSAEYVGIDVTEYSPIKYAERMYADSTDDVKQVLEGMLNYAYYAEVVANGSSSLLIDFNQASGAQLSSFDAKDFYDADLVRDDVDGTAINSVATVGANLTDGVSLIFQVAEGVTVNSLTLQVAGETFVYTPEGGYIEITDLHAGMIGAKLTLTFDTSEGEVVATYAIANYLDMVAQSGELSAAKSNLARAAALYMAAVRDYAMN